MSIDSNYVVQIEKRIEYLEEENKKLRSLVDNNIIRLRDHPTFQKRSIFHPFRKTINDALEFGYCHMKWKGYSRVNEFIRTSPKGLVEKIKNMRVGEEHLYPSIKCKFNGLHYPMVDCDNSFDYCEARDFFDSLGVSHFSIESSSLHYWVIGDIGNVDYRNIFYLLRDVTFGDKKHLNCSFDNKFSLIRAFKKKDSEYPMVYSLRHEDRLATQNFKKFYEKVNTYFSSEYPVYFGKQEKIGKVDEL